MNQDCSFAATVGELGVVAVFDGHGAFGEMAAAIARDALANAVAAQTTWSEAPEACMKAVIATLHDAVLQAHEPDALPPQHLHKTGSGKELVYRLNDDKTAFMVEGDSGPSAQAKRDRSEPIDFGCTAAIAVLSGRTLVTGNLGDSAVLLCCATEDDQLSIRRLSALHAATEAAEQRRIEESCSGTIRFIDGYLQAIRGPMRGHGLQPTRSLGHAVFADYGISAEPHVVSLCLDDVGGLEGCNGFAVVVLSDGVTDLLTDSAVLDTVAEADAARQAAQQVVEAAAGLADVSTSGADRDDASAAVMYF